MLGAMAKALKGPTRTCKQDTGRGRSPNENTLLINARNCQRFQLITTPIKGNGKLGNVNTDLQGLKLRARQLLLFLAAGASKSFNLALINNNV